MSSNSCTDCLIASKQVQLVKKVPKVEKDARVKMVFPAKTVDLVSQVFGVKKVSAVRRV